MTFDLSGAPAATSDTAQRRVLLPAELPPSLLEQLGGGHALRPIHSLVGATMGTYWRARIVERTTARDDDAAQANTILVDAFAEVVALMSPWEPQSDLARFARAAPGEWVTLAPATAHVLARALEVAALTDGAYSPALGEVTALLGFGPGDPDARLAIDSPEIRAARARADYRRLEFDPIRRAVRQRNAPDTPHDSAARANDATQPRSATASRPSNTATSDAASALQIDLCSIAKGYAVDLASERLHAAGWHNHFIEIGGEARGRGCKPDGQPWWCHLETPTAGHAPHAPGTTAAPESAHEHAAQSPSRSASANATGAKAAPTAGLDDAAPNHGTADTVAGLCELAIASSGNTYHHFEDAAGRVIGHILRPEDFCAPTAAAQPDALHGVTVLAATCMEADVWATALFALGPERGLPLAEAQGLAARWLCTTAPDTAPALHEIATSHFAQLIE